MIVDLPKVIDNIWEREPGEPIAISRILDHRVHPEGLDVDRIRVFDEATVPLDAGAGHIVSVVRGSLSVRSVKEPGRPLNLGSPAHLYVPPGWRAELDCVAGTDLVRVSSAGASKAIGDRLLVRDEEFLAASGTRSQALRWVLTSQYLSRRVFLRSDATLVSKSGSPVSWYRTTMFDVGGLPPNDDGEPVFKMAYNSRTEFNVCYEVEGSARVRMAIHPYRDVGQEWGPWHSIDGDSTYHLNETSSGTAVEHHVDARTGAVRSARNKHEVHIAGHVTLCCLFDPAPTGIESHRAGQYSDYEPYTSVLGSQRYESYMRELTRFDEMVDRLSVAKALSVLAEFHGTPLWAIFMEGLQAKEAREADLIQLTAADGDGRDQIVAGWTRDGAAAG